MESWYFGDDQISEISKKHYGTLSKCRLPPLHPTTFLGDTIELRKCPNEIGICPQALIRKFKQIINNKSQAYHKEC